MRVLFICNQNQNRSKTAEEVFRTEFETRSAGLFNESPVSGRDIEWADLICVMEEDQRIELAKRFPGQYMKKRIINLHIPDIYYYKQAELISTLRRKSNQLNALTSP